MNCYVIVTLTAARDLNATYKIISFWIGWHVAVFHNLRLADPLEYLDFLQLMSSASLVLTDSGGIQEETTVLQIPCLTLRENTERPITTEVGSNKIVGTDTEKIVAAYKQAVSGGFGVVETPPLWDGHAADRIVQVLLEKL